MLHRPLEERDSGWNICMNRRHGLKVGQVRIPLWTRTVWKLENWKTQIYELECKKRDNPEGREMRQRRRTSDYGAGILCFKPCIIFNYLPSHWQRTWRCFGSKGKPKATPLEGCHAVKPFSWPTVLLWRHSHQATGRGWICKMLWSPRCCELSAELHPFEALLVRAGAFLTVCIVPEHFCTHYAPWKSSLSSSALPRISHPCSRDILQFCLDPSSWVKRCFFISSWSFRSLLPVLARKLCQSKSALFRCC